MEEVVQPSRFDSILRLNELAQERDAIVDDEDAPADLPATYTKAPAPLTITWDQFMAETFPPVPSMWGDALLVKGGGYLIASGDTGVGKTILEANLLLSLAAGRDHFLGFPLPGRPVRCLLLEAEGSRGLFRDRLKQIADNLGIRGSLPIFFHARGSELSIKTAGDLISDANAEVAAYDPIGRFHEGNENDTGDWRNRISNPLGRISAELDVAQLFSDHYSKPNENRSGQHKVRGSAAKLQDCGAALRLEYGRGGGSSRILFVDRVRDGAVPEPNAIALRMDVKAGTVELDPDTIPEAIASTTAETRAEKQRLKRAEHAHGRLAEAMKRLMSWPDWSGQVSERFLAEQSSLSRGSQAFEDALRGFEQRKEWRRLDSGGWTVNR